MKKLKIDKDITDAVEFGAGYGTFTLPAASVISGKLFALEIEQDLIANLRKKISERSIDNIEIVKRDFVSDGTGLSDNSVDSAMLFNILHNENPAELLKEAYRVLKKDGRAAVMHWIYSEDTPRGPSLKIRPKPEQCREWLKEAGFEIEKEYIELPPFHYGVVGKKMTSK